ncbi:MAG: hypothetical protein V3U87_06030 [Methylococcaceae bacterium]
MKIRSTLAARCLLGEDASRIKGYAATIMTTVRHLCMQLFQQEASSLSLD